MNTIILLKFRKEASFKNAKGIQVVFQCKSSAGNWKGFQQLKKKKNPLCCLLLPPPKAEMKEKQNKTKTEGLQMTLESLRNLLNFQLIFLVD